MKRELIMQEIIAIVQAVKKDDTAVDLQNDCSAPFKSKGINLDSLATINILIRIEKKFAIDVSQAPISRDDFTSVETITDFVHGLIEKKTAGPEQQAKAD